MDFRSETTSTYILDNSRAFPHVSYMIYLFSRKLGQHSLKSFKQSTNIDINPSLLSPFGGRIVSTRSHGEAAGERERRRHEPESPVRESYIFPERDFRIFGIFPENLDFLIFFRVPGVREGFRKLSGGGTLHSGRIWAHTEPYGPHAIRFS